MSWFYLEVFSGDSWFVWPPTEICQDLNVDNIMLLASFFSLENS